MPVTQYYADDNNMGKSSGNLVTNANKKSCFHQFVNNAQILVDDKCVFVSLSM